MDPATWVNGPAAGSYYGRSAAIKDSFESISPSALIQARSSPVASELAEANWEVVESLFERNWFGPCNCCDCAWGALRFSRSYEAGLTEALAPHAAAGVSAPRAVASTASSSSQSCFPAFLTRPRRVPEPPSFEPPTQMDGIPDTPVLYGAAAAPAPVPPFTALAPKGSSPPKAVPVPRRADNVDVSDNALPPALDGSEPVPAAAPAQPALLEYPAAGAGASGCTTQGTDIVPQLGTWADRQYRLLDSVPERGDNGLASGSGASERSSSIAARSPVASVGRGAAMLLRPPHGPGQNSSSACGSGSGECVTGGSGSSAAGRDPSASPILFNASMPSQDRSSHMDGQVTPNGVACGYTGGGGGCVGNGCSGTALADLAEQGRRRPGQEALLRSGGYLQAPEDSSASHSTAVNHHHHNHNHHQQQQQGAAPTAAQQPSQQQQPPPQDTEALIQEAAWRWRFTRRWQAEQARTEPERAGSLTTDQMDEALAYLNATGATTTTSVSVQIGAHAGRGAHNRGRGGPGAGASTEGSLLVQSLLGGTLGGGPSTLGGEWPLGACSGSGSFTSGPRILGRQGSGELLAASREVASLNRRAVVALQQQLECELQADRRVQESLAQGPPWVGHLIPVVQIDEWGSFRFLMLKLQDRSGRAAGSERQRILIRGHNYCSEGQLVEECNREILSLSQKHAVPMETPTVMGGGVMEWRRDRDRHLHLHSGFVMDRSLPAAAMGLGGAGMAGAAAAAAGRPASAMDLLNLAAAVVRQSFPPTYKITVLT
ncbi:hypothetical protein Agub_g11673 [Astrephomene gubernaculifera]|uniref:Uncharacterized protein n=1 Tax=Astrephomene gubernaculifera TaxID=47775 RepID=A0AAD3DXC4_9CHLO|nr:hypothetical protein Agub_g11673 [Astrephomene gubernaculifera]